MCIIKIVIPVLNDNGLYSEVSPHFGRAPFYAVVEIKENRNYSVEIYPNQSQHFGGSGRPSENIIKHSPDVVITYGMGPRAISLLKQFNIKI
ncbi:MAG: NifB/NifX family molybdenum-iron cluster-binding protein, partial [Candidatus Odinarchaeia archaeon]